MSENGEENINDIREKIIQECTCVSQIFFNITNYLKEFQQLKEEYLKEIYGKIGLSQNSYSNSSENKNMGIRTEEKKINMFYKKNKNNQKKNNINQKEYKDNQIEKINQNQLKVKSIFEEDININENNNNIINNNNNIEKDNNSSSLFNIFNEIREDVLNKPEVVKKKRKKKRKKK